MESRMDLYFLLCWKKQIKQLLVLSAHFTNLWEGAYFLCQMLLLYFGAETEQILWFDRDLERCSCFLFSLCRFCSETNHFVEVVHNWFFLYQVLACSYNRNYSFFDLLHTLSWVPWLPGNYFFDRSPLHIFSHQGLELSHYHCYQSWGIQSKLPSVELFHHCYTS